MRRVYTKKTNAKEVALKQLRKTRAKLMAEHPELMAMMRKYAQAMHIRGEAAQANANASTDIKPKAPVVAATDEVTVDKQKNVSAVMKFLEEKEAETGQQSVRLNSVVRALLAKHLR